MYDMPGCSASPYNDDHESTIEPFSPDVSEYVPSIQYHDVSRGVEENEEQPVENESVHLSDSIEDIKTEKQTKSRPCKKRKANRASWRDAVLKKKKNTGLSFTNKRGKNIPARNMRGGCNVKCTRKCQEKFSFDIRQQLFQKFWALGDHNLQVEYVSRLVTRRPRKRIINAERDSRMHWPFIYTLIADNVPTLVCKTMFLDTFDISDTWIETMFEKMSSDGIGLIEKDMRDQHSNRKNRILDNIKCTVRQHINSVPAVESHYVRKKTSRLYFEETLNLTKLYDLYQSWVPQTHPSSTLATLRQYRKIFNRQFNIAFFKPKKDQCVTCHVYRNASEEEKASLSLKYTLHLANKIVVRQLKDLDKEACKNSKTMIVACYDLQKVLTTTYSELSTFYHKRKLE